MKTIKQFFLTMAVVLSTLTASAVTQRERPSANISIPQKITTGEFKDYYKISNADELYGFARIINMEGAKTANAVLTNDIVINTSVTGSVLCDVWIPIGKDEDHLFNGIFDGNGHTISGLYYNYTSSSPSLYPSGNNIVGLFGYVASATIKNVGVINSHIYTTGSFVGGICGYVASGATLISKCYYTGDITASNGFVGGICGGLLTGVIEYCYNTGTVTSTTTSESGSTGGIVGYTKGDAQVRDCYNTGTVTGKGNNIGGICGGDYHGGTIINCYYLEGCATASGNYKQSGVGTGKVDYYGVMIPDIYGKTTSATENEFKSGKVTYFLNRQKTGSSEIVWYQTINTDKAPVLLSSHKTVYGSSTCVSKFANTSVSAEQHSPDDFGHCSKCNRYVAEIPYSNGTYKISTVAQLYTFAYMVNIGNISINAELTNDIVVNTNVLKDDGSLNGDGSNFHPWTPIGTNLKVKPNYNPYSGTFDGKGHIISGLYYDNELNARYPAGGNYIGLFGYVASGATIKNVGLVDSYFRGVKYIGGICGSGGEQIDCYNASTIECRKSDGEYIGGISGSVGKQTNCYNIGTVIGYKYVGGICGYGGNSTTVPPQTNCYNTGTITGYDYIGGICGSNGEQINCYNTGTIKNGLNQRGNYIGGICGSNGKQTNCYNTGDITGGQYLGGITGNAGTQTNCYNIGVLKSDYTYERGEICGKGGTQKNCYYYGTVSAGGGVKCTLEEFASGYVAYLLNESKLNGTTWRQDLYADATPVLNTNHNAVTGHTTESNNVITVVGNLVVKTNYEVAEGKTLIIPSNASLTTTGNAVVTNNGTISCDGTISGNNLAGNGSFFYTKITESDITFNTTSYPYKGSDYVIGDGLQVTYANRTICGKTFTFGGSAATVTYKNNRNVGTATITWNGTISKQFTISQKEIALNWSNTNLTYNGSDQLPTATASGVVSGETCTVNVEGAQTNAGTYTATASSLSNSNYKLPNAKTTQFTIASKTVSNPTIELSQTSYTYDGTEKYPTVTVKDGTTAIASTEYTVGYSSNKNVGTATVIVTDNNDGNYTVSGTKTFSITKKTITASASANNREYNGTDVATGIINLDGVVEGDAVTTTYSSAAFADKNVGANKNVTFNGIDISGAAAGNYTLNNTTVTVKASITAKTLTFSSISAESKVYNGNAATTVTIIADNIVDGDEVSVSGTNATFADKNVGDNKTVSFTFSKSGADAANYVFENTTGTTTASITAKEANLEWSNTTLTYNGENQKPTATVTNLVEGDDCAVTVSGEQKNANTYTATATDLSNSNYKLPNDASCEFTISPKTGVVVTITENSGEFVYNTEEQSVEGYTVSIDDELGIYSEDDFTFSGSAEVKGKNAGEYEMNIMATDFSNTNANFADVEFVIVDGALTITQAPEAPNKPEATMETKFISTRYIVLPEGWQWVENKELELGVNTAIANYEGADKGNYEVESVEITITRHECAHGEGTETLLAVEATCTTEGYSGDLCCKLCGMVYKQGHTTDALGHDFAETVVAPTCTAEGYTEHLCKRCQHIEYSDTVAATGHKADIVAFENIKAATCTVDGSKDSVVYCSVCHAELSRTKVVIKATGHTVVVDAAVEATATTEGHTEGSHCSVCGEVIVEQKVIPALADNGGENQGGQNQGGNEENQNGNQVEEPATAVDDNAAEPVSIYAYNNTIVVEAADAIEGEITVFDVNGRMMVKTLAAGSRTEIQMQREGLYIICVGDQSKRVIIY